MAFRKPGWIARVVAGLMLGEFAGWVIFRHRPYPQDMWHSTRRSKKAPG